MFRNLMTFALVLTLGLGAAAQVAHNPTWGSAPAASIPPSGSGGGASSPTNTWTETLSVNQVGNASGVIVTMNLSHTYAGDLIISMTHCGTTVVLSDGDGFVNGQFNNYGGQYTFRDDATTAINDIASTVTAGTFDPGAYLPDNPLSAFAGLPAGGDWTFSIYDRYGGDVGTLASWNFTVALAGTRVTQNALGITVPPAGTGGGAFGGANNTVYHDIVMPAGGRVGDLALSFNLNHTYAGDLQIYLEKDGVRRKVFSGGSGGQGYSGNGIFGPNFAGWYHFWDRFAVPSTANVTGFVTFDPGFYRFHENMTPFHGMDIGGTWTLIIFDDAGGDVGTLNDVVLNVAAMNYDVAISQPNGSADILTDITGGSGGAGNTFFNAFTFTQGNYPNGWFYGVDVTMADLFISLSNPGPPFQGPLDGCGGISYTLGGPIPAGLSIYAVSLEIQAGLMRQVTLPTTYTTVP